VVTTGVVACGVTLLVVMLDKLTLMPSRACTSSSSASESACKRVLCTSVHKPGCGELVNNGGRERVQGQNAGADHRGGSKEEERWRRHMQDSSIEKEKT